MTLVMVTNLKLVYKVSYQYQGAVESQRTSIHRKIRTMDTDTMDTVVTMVQKDGHRNLSLLVGWRQIPLNVIPGIHVLNPLPLLTILMVITTEALMSTLIQRSTVSKASQVIPLTINTLLKFQ